ncbi:F-box and WD repeat domain containing protein 10B [Embiotoca jacksoni]|uniref:F-box and WD repeat domain containing protein 10B n=1 Tax=Embiotoca jacksoni TaxID=100190 RepID=UPI003704BA77
MESVKVGKSDSADELNYKKTETCRSMCGMCPSCVFAPTPPTRSRCLWKMSDKVKRRFVVALLSRCGSVQVLESVRSLLGVTSWTMFTYARSRRPAAPRDLPSRGSQRALAEKPLSVDTDAIYSWFDGSPEWIKSDYLCRIFSLCDSEFLRMVSNLTGVFLARQKRGFLYFNASSHNTSQNDWDSEDPALMVVPGSSKSLSGVSLYRNFLSCLPVHLSKKILGLLDEHSLIRSKKVCQYWHHLVQETMEEIKLRRFLTYQIEAMMKRYTTGNIVSSTYANVAKVSVPVSDGEKEEIPSTANKVKLFEAAYAKIPTKTVQMEERNVYCGVYFTKVLLDNKDPQRVLDYRGGPLLATGSKDSSVHLLHVASEVKKVAVMRGHIGSVRAVLLCEGRDLLITGGCNARIRCWNVKTDCCDMILMGHTSTINCLDVHGDKLVSGAKDCSVKVWSLQTGLPFEEFHFKHPESVRCVKINETTVYSSCDRGLVKIWSLENAMLLQVINAHKNSVRCLFFDEWHLLSGDANGKVMAWSVRCEAKESLVTFDHPNEVRSLTLIYLRVITGCADGKIRIFNFLTGDCLKDILPEAESGRILSVHFHDNSILVNATSSVKLYQFAKVFWEYDNSAQAEQGDEVTKDGLVSEKSAASSMKSEKPELLPRTRFQSASSRCQAQAGVSCEFANRSVVLSEKAAGERMKKRGPHHPLTRDSILLKVNAIQKARCMDEASINMEINARLRDSWGPRPPQDLQTQLSPQQLRHDARPGRAQTCVPILKRAVGQNRTSRGSVSTASDARRPITRLSGFMKGTTASPRAHQFALQGPQPNPERCVKTGPGLPSINPSEAFRQQGGLRMLPATQIKDAVDAEGELTLSSEQNLSKRERMTPRQRSNVLQ